MAFMEWSSDLSVGINSIDTQHKVLIKYINELDEAQKNNSERTELGRIIAGLVDYTVRHFQYEEYQFKKYNYADTEAHKKEHEELTQTVLDFKNKFDNGEIDFGPNIMAFLKRWLVEHIMGTDKEYVPCLGEHLH